MLPPVQRHVISSHLAASSVATPLFACFLCRLRPAAVAKASVDADAHVSDEKCKTLPTPLILLRSRRR